MRDRAHVGGRMGHARGHMFGNRTGIGARHGHHVGMQPVTWGSRFHVGPGRSKKVLFCCIGISLVVFGAFLCLPGVVLTAQGNNPTFDDPFFASHNRSTVVTGACLLSFGLCMAAAGIVLLLVFSFCMKNQESTVTTQVQQTQPIMTGVGPPPQGQGAAIYNPVPSGSQPQPYPGPQGYAAQQPYPGQVQTGPQPGYPPAGAQAAGYPPPQAAGYPPPQAAGYPPPQAAGYPPQGSYPPPQAGGYPPSQPAYPLQPYPSGPGFQQVERPPPEAPYPGGQPSAPFMDATTMNEKSPPPPCYDDATK